MSTAAPVPAPVEPGGLSQVQRVLNVFIAPSKTFTDINRSANWVVPFLLIAIFSIVFAAAVDKTITYDKVSENQIKLNKRASAQIERLPEAEKEKAMARGAMSSRISGYGFFVLALIGYVIIAAVLLGTFNFGFGSKMKFGAVLAVVVFASLPMVLKDILATVAVFAGVDPDGFMIQNPVATNLGVLFDVNTHPVLYSLGTSIDVFKIWTLVLGGIGIACISKVKRGTAIGVCFGWYAVLMLFGAAIAAMFM